MGLQLHSFTFLSIKLHYITIKLKTAKTDKLKYSKLLYYTLNVVLNLRLPQKRMEYGQIETFIKLLTHPGKFQKLVKGSG